MIMATMTTGMIMRTDIPTPIRIRTIAAIATTMTSAGGRRYRRIGPGAVSR